MTKTDKLKALQDTLDLQDSDRDEHGQSDRQAGFSRRGIAKRFTEGKCYRIYGGGQLGSYDRKTPSTGTSWERDCLFIFIRKDGKHHMFREARGGWTRTYTDAQLVGKKIEEVSNG